MIRSVLGRYLSGAGLTFGKSFLAVKLYGLLFCLLYSSCAITSFELFK